MKYAFLGSKSLGLRICKAIMQSARYPFDKILTLDDRTDCRSALEGFRESSERWGVDFEVLPASGSRGLFLEPKVELVLVCGYYRLLSRETLCLSRRGFLGIHNSLLPKYRGGAPLVWSIINGDETVGSSLFQISEGVDDGDLFHQWRIPLSPSDRIGEVLEVLEELIAKDIPKLWDEIAEGRLRGRPQNPSTVSFSGQRQPEDGSINWTNPAAKVHDFIRAQSHPYPGAYFFHEGKKIHVHRSRVFEQPYACTPGQVLRIGQTELTIGCGEHSAVVIADLMIEQKSIQITSLFRNLSLRLSPPG